MGGIPRRRRSNLQLFIMGMHHSGTSIMSNLTMELGLPGGYGPDDFLLSPSNPLKYWERRDIVALNQARLMSGGASGRELCRAVHARARDPHLHDLGELYT